MDTQAFAEQLKIKVEALDVSDWKKTYDTLRDLARNSSETVFDKKSRVLLVSESNTLDKNATMIVKLKVPSSTHLRVKFEKPAGTAYASFFVSLSNKYVVPYMYPSYEYELKGREDTGEDYM